jgi:hypothetical protein
MASDSNVVATGRRMKGVDVFIGASEVAICRKMRRCSRAIV